MSVFPTPAQASFPSATRRVIPCLGERCPCCDLPDDVLVAFPLDGDEVRACRVCAMLPHLNDAPVNAWVMLPGGMTRTVELVRAARLVAGLEGLTSLSSIIGPIPTGQDGEGEAWPDSTQEVRLRIMSESVLAEARETLRLARIEAADHFIAEFNRKLPQSRNSPDEALRDMAFLPIGKVAHSRRLAADFVTTVLKDRWWVRDSSFVLVTPLPGVSLLNTPDYTEERWESGWSSSEQEDLAASHLLRLFDYAAKATNHTPHEVLSVLRGIAIAGRLGILKPPHSASFLADQLCTWKFPVQVTDALPRVTKTMFRGPLDGRAEATILAAAQALMDLTNGHAEGCEVAIRALVAQTIREALGGEVSEEDVAEVTRVMRGVRMTAGLTKPRDDVMENLEITVMPKRMAEVRFGLGLVLGDRLIQNHGVGLVMSSTALALAGLGEDVTADQLPWREADLNDMMMRSLEYHETNNKWW